MRRRKCRARAAGGRRPRAHLSARACRKRRAQWRLGRSHRRARSSERPCPPASVEQGLESRAAAGPGSLVGKGRRGLPAPGMGSRRRCSSPGRQSRPPAETWKSQGWPEIGLTLRRC
jgi:hypothetical protein